MEEDRKEDLGEKREGDVKEFSREKHEEHLREDKKGTKHFSKDTKILTEKMRENPWIVSTFALGILALILVIGNFSGASGGAISEKDAGNLVLDLAKSQAVDAELVGVGTKSGLYEVTLLIQENDVPVYVTMDGENLVGGLTPLALLIGDNKPSEVTPTEVAKSDKPKVELFIWSYCPYGVQAQGPMAEVASLFGDKADFKAVLYYDGHGDYETQQNKIQACIQEVAKNKYWDYAAGFVEDIYPLCGQSRDIDCDKTESIKLMKSLGIDSSKVMSCVETKGETLINADAEHAKGLGVTGSPTIIINGVKSNVARNADAIKTAICDSFNIAPTECSTALDSSSAAASGNC